MTLFTQQFPVVRKLALKQKTVSLGHIKLTTVAIVTVHFADQSPSALNFAGI